MTMIERVAQAIVALRYDTRITEGVEPTVMEEARAAIAAMRKPTEKMLPVWHKAEAKEIWQAMIDAALEEK